MSIVRLVIGSTRVATVALVALLTSGQAFAGICIDMNVRLDEREPAAALVESMKSEATSIWEPYGVWFRWEATPSLAQCVWTQASFDVLFDQHPQPGRSFNLILGSTHLALRAIDHLPIHIDHEATEELLGSASAGQRARLLGSSIFGPEDIGRALGRVLAHEVGHVLLAVRDHQPRGLMRPTFGAADLLDPQRRLYTLSPAEVTRLRQRERALDVSASEQTDDWPVASMARAVSTDAPNGLPLVIVAPRAGWGSGTPGSAGFVPLNSR
jgi:hypothetical protein